MRFLGWCGRITIRLAGTIKGKRMPDASRLDDSVPSGETQKRRQIRKIDVSALTTLFHEWMQGDEAEQRETFDLFRRSLDENRPEGYKLFR